jgi:predicted transcriptional regulator
MGARGFFAAEPAQRAVTRLATELQADATELAAVLQLDRSTLFRLMRGRRLRYDAADRIAVALGRHPSELWPDWFGPLNPRERIS